MCFLCSTMVFPKKSTDFFFFPPLMEVEELNSMAFTCGPQASSKVTKKRA